MTAPAMPIRRSRRWKLGAREEKALANPSPMENIFAERSAPGARRKAWDTLSKGYTNSTYGRLVRISFFMFIAAHSDL